MNVVGRWSQPLPAHFDEGELRSRERCQGTGNVPVRAAIGWEQRHDNVNKTVFQTAQPLWIAQLQRQEYSARGRPHSGPGTHRPRPLCNLSENLSTLPERVNGCGPATIVAFRAKPRA